MSNNNKVGYGLMPSDYPDDDAVMIQSGYGFGNGNIHFYTFPAEYFNKNESRLMDEYDVAIFRVKRKDNE